MPPGIAREKVLDDQELKELIIKALKKQKPSSVRQLINILVTETAADLSTPKIVGLLRELREEGKVELSEAPHTYETLTTYLFDRKASLSFWLVSATIILTWISIYIIPPEFPWIISRWLLGTLFVIFLPGYAFVEALFVNPLSGKKELDEIARFALSIGMSLALVPLVGLLLNYTPWGIRLEPIAVSLSLLTILCIATAAYRKFAQHSRAAALLA